MTRNTDVGHTGKSLEGKNDSQTFTGSRDVFRGVRTQSLVNPVVVVEWPLGCLTYDVTDDTPTVHHLQVYREMSLGVFVRIPPGPPGVP